jgi:hypothetical protein
MSSLLATVTAVDPVVNTITVSSTKSPLEERGPETEDETGRLSQNNADRSIELVTAS